MKATEEINEILGANVSRLENNYRESTEDADNDETVSRLTFELMSDREVVKYICMHIKWTT